MPPSAMYHVLFSRLCNLTVSPCFRSSAKAASRSGINGAMTSARTLSTMLVWPRYENKHCAKSHTGRAGPGAHEKALSKSHLSSKRLIFINGAAQTLCVMANEQAGYFVHDGSSCAIGSGR